MISGKITIEKGMETQKIDREICFRRKADAEPAGPPGSVGNHLSAAVSYGVGKTGADQYGILQRQKKGTILVSFAGPVMNYLLAFASMLVYGLFYKWGSRWGIWFYYLAVINVGLGTFNLIPLPPLDGSNILLELFPKAGRFYSRIRKYALPLLVICLLTGILSVPLSRINSAILDGMWEWVKGIWNIRLLPQGAGYI